MADYYQILGADRNAPAGAIKKAYLKLARERHPDRFTDPVERQKADQFFKDLTAAFNTLSNPSTRRAYDASLPASLTPPKKVDPEDLAAEAYALGLHAYQQQAFEEAVEKFRAAVHYVQNKAAYRAALAQALARSPKTVRDAIAELEKAIQLSPRKVEYHAELAGLYLGQGLKLRARRVAEAGLKVAPQDPRLVKVVQQSA